MIFNACSQTLDCMVYFKYQQCPYLHHHPGQSQTRSGKDLLQKTRERHENVQEGLRIKALTSELDIRTFFFLLKQSIWTSVTMGHQSHNQPFHIYIKCKTESGPNNPRLSCLSFFFTHRRVLFQVRREVKGQKRVLLIKCECRLSDWGRSRGNCWWVALCRTSLRSRRLLPGPDRCRRLKTNTCNLSKYSDWTDPHRFLNITVTSSLSFTLTTLTMQRHPAKWNAFERQRTERICWLAASNVISFQLQLFTHEQQRIHQTDYLVQGVSLCMQCFP